MQRDFEIMATGTPAKGFCSICRKTLAQLKEKHNVHEGEFLCGFTSDTDKDGFKVSLDLYAPMSPDEYPWLQFILWRDDKEIFSTVVDNPAPVDMLEYEVNGDTINLLYVIATKSMLAKSLRGGISQMVSVS